MNQIIHTGVQCKYLHAINNSLPIDLMFEKRCSKLIWSCINSNNTIDKSVSSSEKMYSYSYLGENYTTDFCQIYMIYGQLIRLGHFQVFLENFMTM